MQLTREERNLLHNHAKIEISGEGDLWYFDDEGGAKVRESLGRIVPAARVLEAIGWQHEPDAETYEIDADALGLRRLVRAARDYEAQCLVDDERVLSKGIADPDWRGFGQNGRGVRGQRARAGIEREREAVAALNALLDRLEAVPA